MADLINAINTMDGHRPGVPMTAAIVARDLMSPDALAWLRIASDGEGIQGFATAGLVYDSARAAPCLMLLDLYVRPEARRRGHARALMAALARQALTRGAACLWWGVDDGDDEAMAFYRAIGAEVEEHFAGLILANGALRALAEAPRR